MANFAKLSIFLVVALISAGDCQNPSLHIKNSVLQSIPENIQMCYRGTTFYPSNRLANSLDNLIYLVEKVEDVLVAQNMPTDASRVAAMLLYRFQANGINDIPNLDEKAKYQYEVTKQDIVWSLFPNSTARITFPENALTDKEKCSMHWMLSITHNDTATTDMTYSYDYDPALSYPREGGTVFAGRYGTLSAGHVLSGIAASSVLNPVQVSSLLSPEDLAGVDQSYRSLQIEPILGATLSGELAQTVILYASPDNRRILLGPDGTWNGTNCATTYTWNNWMANLTTGASDSELLGASDGLIMGAYLKRVYYQAGATSGPYLSQVLRSYYGRGLQVNSLSACQRKTSIQQASNRVPDSAIAFAVVYKAKKAMVNTNHEYPTYTTINNDIQASWDQFNSNYLGSGTKLDCSQDVQTYQCSSENDIFVVMDVSAINSADNFQQQKNFVGALIGRIGSYPNASHFGIYTFASSYREPVPFTYTPYYLSGADIRCQLQQYNLYPGNTDGPGTIRYLQDKLRTLRNYQRNSNFAKVPGKVVIFINLQSSVSNREEITLAMDNIRAEFPELTTYAVGSNRAVLENFALKENVFYSPPGEQLSVNVEPIRKKLCTAPATIEYSSCANPNIETEPEWAAETFVYQDTYQWLEIHPWTMNRSTDLALNFESQYGGAHICVRRTISYEAPTYECFDTPSSEPYSYRYEVGDGCEKRACDPLYINIKGKPSGGSGFACNERACESWNQVKVTMTHEGLKCSACQFLSTTSILLIGIFCSLLGQL